MKTKKRRARANGEGTIYPLPDGRWRVVVSASVLGKLKRISRIRRRQSDCLAILPELRSQLGLIETVDSSTTLAAYLKNWLEIIRNNNDVQTWSGYSVSCNKHIIPRLGSAKLAKLQPIHCEQFKAALTADGVPSSAAKHAFQVLRRALRQAVYPLRLIKVNPCDGIKTPEHAKREMKPFEAHEAKMIIQNSSGTRWHAFYAVAFGCGLRAGELFGLRWSDIDTRNGKLSVKHSAQSRFAVPKLKKPKTKSSVRTIDVPRFVVNALREHRVWQMTAGLARCDLVFPSLCGKILHYSNFYKDEWQIRLVRCGLAARGFHNTRHTYASLALLKSPIAVVSKTLGHANPSVTMSVYAHCLPSSENAAAVAMEQLLAAG